MEFDFKIVPFGFLLLALLSYRGVMYRLQLNLKNLIV